jgi:2-keto-3-deoxy-L-rhamnonate aldolase RhmA
MNDTSPYARNEFKHLVLAGKRCSLISFRMARTVDAPMIAKAAGHDAFYVDAQHCPIDGDATAQMLGAAHGIGITPMVRIRGHNQHEIARALDCGALGIIVPDVETGDQAVELARHVRFPPLGRRSISGLTIQTGYAPLPLDDLVTAANHETMLIAMIESRRGVENADAIASIDGIDAILIGANDLTIDLGVAGQHDHPKTVEAFGTVIAAGQKHATPVLAAGIGNLDIIARYIKMGIAPCYFGGMDTKFLLDGARREAEAFRELALE